MDDRSFFFAGGGTGGHIYPAIAVAQQIIEIEPSAKIHFFCSTRSIDKHIIVEAGFEYTALPAVSFSIRPGRFIDFSKSLLRSYRIAKNKIHKNWNIVVIGTGGFVSTPVCLAAHKRKVPIALLNVDIVPGRANKINARWADEIFVQFSETEQYFAGRNRKVSIVGCPIRSGFRNPQPKRAIEQLGLDRDKKILLITGASSGSENINKAICSLLEKLEAFADDWQIVHLAGRNNYEKVYSYYSDAKISNKVVSYFDDMPDLLAAADLVVGRSGAVSVAEYAAAAVPSICMPYPYHKDKHQYLNAGKLVEVGAAVIVDDLPDENDRSEWLAEELEGLMKDHETRQVMAEGCRIIANPDADRKIAEQLLKMAADSTK
ncbi:MAG TPA: UDP-N-acetylglucosamine--N-acetylmuramyl-(pentapeptide) pyrophosphoryl-undecaprenol N-acetylglucosamine transferase [Sedimentisphaerales bacterium]|nr:UDP-N-acetylglucosamine--N-acetylmuramyl-(pentapeptide) pyrophosphoryl-undecaprenol N-acetylglucosamine transferase [Sedimentisphaerales bacterium]